MKQGGGQPSGALAEAIESTFGGPRQAQGRVHTKVRPVRFGWAWLIVDDAGTLKVTLHPQSGQSPDGTT